jgi:hypothetical protein
MTCNVRHPRYHRVRERNRQRKKRGREKQREREDRGGERMLGRSLVKRKRKKGGGRV